MKLEILQENLNKALSFVTRIVSTKPQLPILSHVLISATNGKLTLTTSSLDTTIVAPVGAKIDSEGEFTVPAKTLQELVASLPPGKIILEVKDSTLSLKSGKFSSQINGTPASEFPKNAPDLTSSAGSLWKVNTAGLVNALSKTIFTAASEESRVVLTGVLFKFEQNHVTLAATDGFRLSVVKVTKSAESLAQQDQVIIPTRALVEVIKLATDENPETIQVHFLKNNQVAFLIGDTHIYSQLIAGNFPNFEKIIPSESETQIKFSAEELGKSLRLASIFARESANIVRFQLDNSHLTISANAAQVGDNQSEVDVEVEKGSGQNFQIAFNYRYLLDYIGSLGSKAGEVTADFTTPLAPAVFHSKSDPNFLHLIMPVRVQT